MRFIHLFITFIFIQYLQYQITVSIYYIFLNFLFKIRTFFYFNLIFCDNNAILQGSQKNYLPEAHFFSKIFLVRFTIVYIKPGIPMLYNLYT